MTPSISTDYIRHVRGRNSKLPGQCVRSSLPVVWRIHLPAIRNNILCDFCIAAICSSKSKCSSFFYTVFYIFRLCSRKQVVWITAWRVVAFMANTVSRHYCPTAKPERYSVTAIHSTSAVIPGEPEDAIAANSSAFCLPRPTIIDAFYINIRPEFIKPFIVGVSFHTGSLSINTGGVKWE